MTNANSRSAPASRHDARRQGPSADGAEDVEDRRAASASRRELLLGSLTAAAVAGCAPGAALHLTGQNSAAEQVAADLREEYAFPPALSAAVASPGELLWAKAYGLADVELGVEATPEHSFRLASVCKAVTASLGARLAARGVVDLDAPIAAWLPDLPAHHRATTLRQLFNHQGGVRHYVRQDNDPAISAAPIDARIYPTNAEILSIFIDDPLVAEPGTSVNYSTFGYTLASIVLEAAADTPFPDLVESEIAVPRGLDSLKTDDPVALRPGRARGYGPADFYRPYYPYVGEGLANARMVNPAYKWAGGGLIATPSDLARFGAAHLDPALVTDEERATLFTPRAPAAGSNPPLGLGWRLDADERGRPRWHHAGNMEGARTSLVVYPEQGLSIAFAFNMGDIARDVLTPAAAFADAFA